MALTVASWNVNSIRARLDHVATWLADHEPDVLCLQETKVEDALFPKVPFLELGYTVTLHGGRALCGVAVISKRKPSFVHAGFREGEADRNPRILEVVVDDVRLYCLYAPNGTELGSDAFAYKLAWYERLAQQLRHHHRPDEPLALLGDFNVAPDDRDVWDPEAFRGRLLFTDQEHAALQRLLDFGLHDCFRAHESGAGHYSWYDYRTGGFGRNEGLRIDLVLATEVLARRCTAVTHDATPRGWDTPSDHVPVVARFG
ncbi:MAG: exodeoxyribonuclease III [Nannocystaceae bacterium]|nr:exodeoxyribonuclease III [Nannocystaceae bacterium]